MKKIKQKNSAGLDALINHLKEEKLSKVWLAKQLGIPNQQTITMWVEVPLHRLVDIELVTGFPREIMCPELYDGFVRSEKAT